MNDFEQMMKNPVDRRVFLQRMTAAGLGTAALALFAGCGGNDNNNNNPGFSSADFRGVPGRNINEVVLNYALTLEILESDLYRQALNLASVGKSINDPLAAFSAQDSTYILQPGSAGNLSGTQAAAGFLYLKQYAYVEAAHRDFLRAAIQQGGGTPVTGNPTGYKFPTNTILTDLPSILQALLPLEETGVRAYLGAFKVPSFTADTTGLNYATVAASIYSTEARHSAAISYILGLDPGPTPRPGDLKVTPTYPSSNTFEYYLLPNTVITAVSAYYKSSAG